MSTSSNNPFEKVRERFRSYPATDSLLARLSNSQGAVVRTTISGMVGCSSALLSAEIFSKTDRPLLIVTTTAEQAQDLHDDLQSLISGDLVGLFPARQILPFDFRAPVGEILGQRIATLSGLLTGTVKVVIAPIRATLEPTIPRPDLEQIQLSLKTGIEVDLDEISARLIGLGFSRVPLVEEVGDFARRGGVIDFFSPGADSPVRIELFGDEIESIRYFDVSTQRTIATATQVSVLPRREVLVTSETLESHLHKLSEDEADFIRSRYFNDPELPGLEWLSVLFGLPQGSLLDFLPANAVTVLPSHEELEQESDSILAEGEQLRERMSDRLKSLPTVEEYYHSPSSIRTRLREFSGIDIRPFRTEAADTIHFNLLPHPSFGSRFDLLADTIESYERDAISYVILSDQKVQAERLGELITEKGGLTSIAQVQALNLSGGFVCPDGHFALLTDHEIFHRYHRRVRKKKFREGVAVSDYSALNKGDYVVHADFGIARYLGLETLHVDKRNRDCLLLQFAGTDKVYVPIEEFNRVGKYSGSERTPELTHLGGPGWDRLKDKAAKAVADMADDLLKLYAQRLSATGFAFGDDSLFMQQLEASFPYDETTDQLKAIVDVKGDLAKPRPMDRLVCGDVGYGKTEVAVRGAFKVIDFGKQVAVLVPTTILAQQHFTTFKERFADFPVNVSLLSRFRTKKEQLETVQGLANGTVDLVIGTHRLLSEDIKFKDIGLLVIDEEHRFGVKHKEKLRRLKASVDTLAMTATPIPRTLQMSLMGVRDMSVITTSPKDRLPIITQVIEFDKSTITTAILREIDRGGQVFFVHNRVQTIDSMYEYLKSLLPKVEIGVAHGQMHERSLEGVMLAFLSGKFQVLLCTSIIESGLDISRANTIIINRADRFGLAQLYQLRGRVGRSSQRAYAYLLTPQVKLLRPDAMKRLRALEAHSNLGAGFALAMRDLEIRGAGTLLGAKQSGFIEEIGFDLYNKLLEETIAKLKGEEVIAIPDTKLELEVETYLPESYVPDSQHKVDIYRRLADAKSLETVKEIREEVTDRFGSPPESSKNLFDATGLKIEAARLGAEKIRLTSGRLTILLKEGKNVTRGQVEKLHNATACPMEFSFVPRTTIVIDLAQMKDSDRLSHAQNVLSSI